MNMNKIKVLAIALLATVISAVSLATFAAPVSANNGPHGGYTLTTAACAGCHRAHTAAGADLLKETNVYALCISCHNGDFATTNVKLGMRTGDSAPLNGGGFEQANGLAVTSSHTVEGLGGSSGLGTAWGGASSGQGVSGTLECVSCHNPHGTTNYRILRDSANGYPSGPANAAQHRWVPSDPNLLDWVDTQVIATVDDNFDYAFTASDCPAPGFKCKMNFTSGITYDTVTHATTVDTGKGMNAFCATCHKSYLTLSGSASLPSTDLTGKYVYPGTQNANDGKGDIARYRHAQERTYSGTPQQALRFAAEGTTGAAPAVYDAFGCLTCHFSHGSSSAATGYAATAGPAQDSALLFYDNRGVCISCHQKDKMAP